MLTKSLALDDGREHLRVNCICPGTTDTPRLRYHARHAADREAHLRQRLERVPSGAMLYPEDMGITGASLVADGGYIACAEFIPVA